MKLSKEERLIRASEAERLLNNSLFSEAVLAVRANLYSTIENSGWRHKRMRENTYMQLKNLNSVLNILEREVQTGKLAQKQLNVENKQ